MGKASRQKRRSAVTAARKSRSNLGWYVLTAVVVAAGVGLVAVSAADDAEAVPPLVNDHWHAAIGVNICGTWQPNPPEFSYRMGSQILAGVHSHGDGLIHIHPHSSDEAGERATVGRFFDYGGWDLSEDSFSIWTGASRADGDDCDGEAGTVRWSVDGEEQTGDPADYQPKDREVIAIAFLPEGEEIGEPPSAGNVNAPVDVVPPPSAPGEAPPTGEGEPTDTTTQPTTDTTAAPDTTSP